MCFSTRATYINLSKMAMVIFKPYLLYYNIVDQWTNTSIFWQVHGSLTVFLWACKSVYLCSHNVHIIVSNLACRLLYFPTSMSLTVIPTLAWRSSFLQFKFNTTLEYLWNILSRLLCTVLDITAKKLKELRTFKSHVSYNNHSTLNSHIVESLVHLLLSNIVRVRPELDVTILNCIKKYCFIICS